MSKNLLFGHKAARIFGRICRVRLGGFSLGMGSKENLKGLGSIAVRLVVLGAVATALAKEYWPQSADNSYSPVSSTVAGPILEITPISEVNSQEKLAQALNLMKNTDDPAIVKAAISLDGLRVNNLLRIVQAKNPSQLPQVGLYAEDGGTKFVIELPAQFLARPEIGEIDLAAHLLVNWQIWQRAQPLVGGQRNEFFAKRKQWEQEAWEVVSAQTFFRWAGQATSLEVRGHYAALGSPILH